VEDVALWRLAEKSCGGGGGGFYHEVKILNIETGVHVVK
jgi:hypothetical protein